VPDVDPDDLIRDAPEDKVGTYLPFPLNQRVDALVGQLDAVGMRTSRKEVLAALIFGSPETMQLLQLVRGYRRATVKEAAPRGYEGASFTQRASRGRGRRGRA